MPSTFRFLDLPLDLRLIVYECLPIKARRITLGSSGSGLVANSVDTAILLTCKHVYAEAEPILSARLKKHQSDPINQTVRLVLDVSDLFGILIVVSIFGAFDNAKATPDRKVNATDIRLPPGVARVEDEAVRQEYIAFGKRSAEWLLHTRNVLTDLQIVIVDQEASKQGVLHTHLPSAIWELSTFYRRWSERGKPIKIALSVMGRLGGSSGKTPRAFIDNEILKVIIALEGMEGVEYMEKPNDKEWEAVWAGHNLPM